MVVLNMFLAICLSYMVMKYNHVVKGVLDGTVFGYSINASQHQFVTIDLV